MKHIRVIIIAAILVAILAVCTAILLVRKGSDAGGATYAHIYLDGAKVRDIRLDTLRAPLTFTVRAADGGFNTVRATADGIEVTDADCPDRICVETGRSNSEAKPIICAPHGLVIEVSEDAGD